MSAPLRVGDKIICRYYNTPENRFYGDVFTAEITSVNACANYCPYPSYIPHHKYAARRLDDKRIVILDRREIV